MDEEVPYISINEVTFHYGSTAPVLRNISLHCGQSSTIILTGANGAGKSTLLKLLLGLLSPQQGTILVAGKITTGKALHELAENVAVSLQSAEHQIFSPTVRKEISFGPTNLRKVNTDLLVADAMEMFSLSEYAERHPYDLHASQRKLITLASAVAMDTPFLIFDEPTVGLSMPEKKIFSNALSLLRKRGKGYILITHDATFGFQHCERILILRDGRCVVDDSLSRFLIRPDALGAMKRAKVQLPVSSRLSRLFGQRPVATSVRDFVPFLKEKANDY
jgi:energy-coupling factor transport system ATP-binding protein